MQCCWGERGRVNRRCSDQGRGLWKGHRVEDVGDAAGVGKWERGRVCGVRTAERRRGRGEGGAERRASGAGRSWRRGLATRFFSACRTSMKCTSWGRNRGGRSILTESCSCRGARRIVGGRCLLLVGCTRWKRRSGDVAASGGDWVHLVWFGGDSRWRWKRDQWDNSRVYGDAGGGCLGAGVFWPANFVRWAGPEVW